MDHVIDDDTITAAVGAFGARFLVQAADSDGSVSVFECRMAPESQRRAAMTCDWVEAHDIIGLAIRDARVLAGRPGIEVRVLVQDGVRGLRTDGVDRVNVVIAGRGSRVIELY
jgi:hypothetical protein